MAQAQHERALELPGVVYRLLRLLGRGSFGEVWLAEAPGNVQVAVKIIARALRDDQADRELKALQIIKGLRHQYLLSIHSYFVQEDQLIIVYELADGNLRQRLNACRQAGQSGIPVAELLGYFREAAEALDYLHSHDVHHRDIKSENVLLLGRHAKVADYGLARMLEKHSLQTASTVGTPAYMAPEVWEGKVSPHSDQYSLAVSYVELRLGKLPFDADGMGQLIRAHLQQKPDLAGLGMEEQAVLERALAKEAGQRYPSCTALLDALTAACGPLPAAVQGEHPAIAPVRLPEPILTDPPPRLNDPTTNYRKGGQANTPPAPMPRLAPSTGTLSPRDTVGPGGIAPVPLSWKPKPTPRRWPVFALPALAACVVLFGTAFLLWQFGPWASPTRTGEWDGRSDIRPPFSKVDDPPDTPDKLPPPPPKVAAKPNPAASDKTLELDLGGGVTIKLVRIEPGTFQMGSPAAEAAREAEELQHEVRITRPFYLAIYEVTQAQYDRVMGENPSWFSAEGGGKAKVAGLDTLKFPVEKVSWKDARAFCKKLSSWPSVKAGGWTVNLPTEAEWEYACRAGTASRFSTGDDDVRLEQAGWFIGNSDSRTHAVGEKAPNAWGLYDMHGNVWEWCADGYDVKYYEISPKDDPAGPGESALQVLRGGSWFFKHKACRAAMRGYYEPDLNNIGVGFRVAVLLAPRQPNQATKDKPKVIVEKVPPPPKPKDKHLELDLGGGVTMKLARIEPGTFQMGSPASEAGRFEDEQQHEVRITRPFYLGIHEVTQAQYEQIMGMNPCYFSAAGGGKNKVNGLDTRTFPVEMVSWHDAKEFCKRVSELPAVKAKGWTLDLPTEAEWEYAYRAGTKSRFYTGEDDTDQGRAGWFDSNSDFRPHSVGEKTGNAWGLFDMSGNVWEWCADWYGSKYYETTPRDDPPGPTSGKFRILRGGSWFYDTSYARAAGRFQSGPPTNRDHNIGFRVLLR